MNGIVHIRIDDRLIHGQVATIWTSHFRANRILIPNDEVAVNDIQKQVLRMAAPDGVNTSLINVDKAATNIIAKKYASQRVLLVTNSPIDILRLIEMGVKIEKFNVGNMQKRDGTLQIKKSIWILPEEREAFEKLIEMGVEITAQMVPAEKAPLLSELL